MRRFSFGSAIWASIVATVAMTVAMWFFGVNLMNMLGVTAGKSGTTAYLIGGVIHFGIGIVFGLIYALIFEPILKGLPGFLAGALYSILPFFIAILFMGPFANAIKSTFNSQPKKSAIVKKMDENKYNYKRDGSYSHTAATPKPVAKPQSKKGSGWLSSLVGHLVYGIFLGWIYRPKFVRS